MICARLIFFRAVSVALLLLCESGSHCALAQSAQPAQSAQLANDWRETLNDDGIQVYKRTRLGSAYEEVRALARLSARVDDFIPFFTEPAQYKRWVYGTVESGLVSRTQPFDFTFKGVFKIPWPFENRELISRVEIERKPDGSALTAKLNHADSRAAVTSGCVRVSHFESLWQVKQEDAKTVNFRIEMYVEPGGQLPPFIVNLVLSRIQLWSIKNLKREIALR